MLGGLLAVISLSIFLNGIQTLQTWNYFRAYPGDRLSTKLFVGIIYIADIVDTIMLAWLLCFVGAQTSGRALDPRVALQVSSASYAVESTITLTVQSYYCLRIYLFTRSFTIALPSSLLVLGHVVTKIWVITIMSSYDGSNPVAVRHKLRGPATASLVFAALADVFITSCICVRMIRMRSGMPRSDRVLDRLVAFTVGRKRAINMHARHCRAHHVPGNRSRR